MKKLFCLLIVLCLCTAAAVAENGAIWQLAEDVLVHAELVDGESAPVYTKDTLTALVKEGEARGLDTSAFAWLAEENSHNALHVFEIMLDAAYGVLDADMSMEQQFNYFDTLYRAGLTDIDYTGMTDESDMTEDQILAHAADLIYWNFGVRLPSDDPQVCEMSCRFVFSGMREDDFCWNVVAYSVEDGQTYSIIFDRQGQALDGYAAQSIMSEEELYFIRMPLAFMSLAEQQRILGDEFSPLDNERTIPKDYEPTADDVIEMAIQAVVNGNGEDLRANPITGDACSALIDTLQLGVSCQRITNGEDDPNARLMWEVYMTSDPYQPTDGFRVTYVYRCNDDQFNNAEIHDITDCSHG